MKPITFITNVNLFLNKTSMFWQSRILRVQMFQQPNILTAQYSDSPYCSAHPMFWQPNVLTAQCSDSSMFWQPNALTSLIFPYSPLFWKPAVVTVHIVPTAQCSDDPVFRRSSVLKFHLNSTAYLIPGAQRHKPLQLVNREIECHRSGISSYVICWLRNKISSFRDIHWSILLYGVFHQKVHWP